MKAVALAGGVMIALCGAGRVAADVAAASQAVSPENAKSAETLRGELIASYGKIKTYQARVVLHVKAVGGEQGPPPQTFSYDVAFDRGSSSAKLVRPDLSLLIHREKLQIKANQITERHLEVDWKQSLSFEKLAAEFTFLKEPRPIPLPLLWGESDFLPPTVTYLAPDAQGRPGLERVVVHEMNGAQQRLTYTIRVNPATKLFSEINANISLAVPGQPERKFELQGTWQDEKVDQPLPSDVFALDVKGSTAVGTVREMVGQPPDATSLKGKAAPSFTLKTNQGADVSLEALMRDNKIVVLDFWATWCGPCRMTLPQLDRVNKWAVEKKLPVAIYTVNLQETEAQANEMFKQLNVTLPILMDKDARVGNSYMAHSIPLMVVIHQGKIHDVHIGASPTTGSDLQAEISRLLDVK